MKKILTFTTFCVLFAMLLPCIGAVPVNAYKKASYDDVKNDTTEELKGQIDALNASLEENKKALEEADRLQATAEEKREIYLTLEALYTDTLGAMEDELTLIGLRAEELETQISEAQAEYEEKYDEFLDLLKMIYEEGTPNYIEIIVGASSFSDMLSRIERLRSVLGYSETLMENLKTKKAELKASLEKQLALAAEKNESIALYEAKSQELAEWQVENEEEILAIEAEIERMIAENEGYESKEDVLEADFQAVVNKLLADENARRAEIERQEKIAAQKAEESRKAAAEAARLKALEDAARGQKYLWPLPMSENIVTYSFGMRYHPVYKRNQMHYGIDIAAGKGTPIYAAKSGTVTTATYHASAGYYVVINHLDGTSTMYEHGLANSFKVKKGDTVQQGQQIMSVGTTGVSTGYHLHFEVVYAGISKDPLGADVPLIKPSNLIIRG